MKTEFLNLTAGEFADYINDTKEKDYLLLDVRLPSEYEAHHIPGSISMPLSEFEKNLRNLPSDREIVLYCHSGGRSRAAAMMIAESGVTRKKIYNLLYGISGWDGKKLENYPRIEIFHKGTDFSSLFLTAMGLEKGAMLFYRHMLKTYADKPLGPLLENLADDEISHARILFDIWNRVQDPTETFTPVFDTLEDDILEGGEKLSAMFSRIESLEGDTCMNLLELAMEVEYAAYDLYRNLAEKTEDDVVRDALILISQAEKSHIKSLVNAIDLCFESHEWCISGNHENLGDICNEKK